MKKPNCPCWGCEDRMPTCKRECEAFKQYEKAYKVFDAERRSEREKKDAARYISARSKKAWRDALNNQKLRKKP